MRHHRTLPLLLLACGLVLVALPAAAEIYTIKLTNGTSFESRYQPKQAAWDTSMLTFLDELGTEIALPQALVAEVIAQSEAKGFGKVINTTTIDLGFAPNDLDQNAQAMAQQSNPFEAMIRRNDQKQFVEPGEMGGGIPLGFGSYGGGNGGAGTGYTPPAPAPAAPAAPGAPATAPTTPPQQR
jgi:hypothetical protein